MVSKLADLDSDLSGLAEMPPIKVERDKHLHVIVGSRLIGEAQLGVGVGVGSDVQGKGINAIFLGSFHVSVIVTGVLAVADHANLGYISGGFLSIFNG